MAACVLYSSDCRCQEDSTLAIVLETSVGSSLVSSNQPVDPRGFSSPVTLEFSFGFSTDEVVVPGQFFDAFSVSLASEADPAQAAIYLTVDASGMVVAPITPGTIRLSPDDFLFTEVGVPDGVPGLSSHWAYHVSAPVPELLSNQPLEIYFDLFDNGDGIDSFAWASEVTVVPEPTTFALMVVGAFLWGLRIGGRRSAS